MAALTGIDFENCFGKDKFHIHFLSSHVKCKRAPFQRALFLRSNLISLDIFKEMRFDSQSLFNRKHIAIY